MKVERIDHIHVAVKDLDKAVGFFERVLGTKFSEAVPAGIESTTGSLEMRSVLDPLGLEVISPTSESSPIAKFLERRGEGLHAISFKVDDLDAWVTHLQEQGLRLVGQIKVGGLREAQFHPKDSFGFMIELCEYEDQSPTYMATLGRE